MAAEHASGRKARQQALYDEGVARLEAAWDDGLGLVREQTAAGFGHSPRASLAYASVLLRRGRKADLARASRIIAVVETMQERREQDAHYGNFRWYYEHETVHDLNAVEFVLDHLNAILREHAAILPDAAKERIEEMIALGLDEIDRLNVHPSYTNIVLSDICNSVLGGEALGEPMYVERGRARLAEWWEFTNQAGAPHEYNSPTYLSVDISRMAALAEHTRNPEIALMARMAEERLWLHVAAHYAPQLAQLAGPHSRSYRDGWTGAGGLLKLALWVLLGDDNLRRPTPYYPAGREEGHTGIGEATYHCPEYIADWMRERALPFDSAEIADAKRGSSITTHIARDFALGTATASWGVGEPPEEWPAPNSFLLHFAKDEAPGYGVVMSRFVVNDREPPLAAGDGDYYEEGRFAAVQNGPRAIVAYGLLPRLRAATSYKLSVHFIGLPASAEVWVGDARMANRPATIYPGDPITVAAGRAYIAIIPLDPADLGSDAPIELRREGETLTLDIYNYRGPAKTFWEHRSNGGPFYQGTVSNAFVVEAADRDAYPSFEAFRAHFATLAVHDGTDHDNIRDIVYASGEHSMSMRYSLMDMRLLSRVFDGVPHVSPQARAGAATGPQFIQSQEPLIDLPGARLLGGRSAKWLFADADRQRYVAGNPDPLFGPFRIDTRASTAVACEEFGFGRIDIDDATGEIEIDALGEIGPVGVRRDGDLRLSINGVDVTSRLSRTDEAGFRWFEGI